MLADCFAGAAVEVAELEAVLRHDMFLSAFLGAERRMRGRHE